MAERFYLLLPESWDEDEDDTRVSAYKKEFGL
jgi:hypothetical protein